MVFPPGYLASVPLNGLVLCITLRFLLFPILISISNVFLVSFRLGGGFKKIDGPIANASHFPKKMKTTRTKERKGQIWTQFRIVLRETWKHVKGAPSPRLPTSLLSLRPKINTQSTNLPATKLDATSLGEKLTICLLSHTLCCIMRCILDQLVARPSPWCALHGGTVPRAYHYQAYRSGWFVLLPKKNVLHLPRWSQLRWFGGCFGQRWGGSRNRTLLEVGSGGTTLEWQISVVLLRQPKIVVPEETIKENMGDLVFVHCHVMRHQELKQARTHKRHFDTKNGGIQIKIRDR